MSTPLDASGVPYLENGEYQGVIDDINAACFKGLPFDMSIYLDSTGTTYAKDNLGNDIIDRRVASTTYIYPYQDMSGNVIDGYFTILFTDGTYFGNNDSNDKAYWYTITGLTPVVYKQFT
jgi:hypothetical protein